MNPLDPPRMTVLGDQPLQGDALSDALDLAVKLGPVFDILRHPDTRTPLSIAIYGDWGSGKTSAMRWLESMLRRWNDRDIGSMHSLSNDEGKKVRPVWFFPWKYQAKEDVWRGLIAEVILASIDARDATEERMLRAVTQFGRFLGRSFLHVLQGMRLKGVDVAKKIAEEYEKALHPEAAYLNQFENTLRRWIRDTISEADERMVIFIDDLDRCMPDVALQVLEALKLYLDIEDLIFVVGVDRAVVDQLVQNLYGKLGLLQEKSKHYLAKMFQVEVVIGPNERQAESFLDTQLDAIAERTNQYWTRELENHQREVFRRVVLRLAERNPREIKRLLNSVLIHGAGALHVASRPFSFAQGMQIFLVRKILDERYTMGLTVDTRTGMEFFHAWSKLVQADAPIIVPYPEELAQRFLHGTKDEESLFGRVEESAPGAGDAGQPAADLPDTPYAVLLRDPRYAHLWKLLADRELGELMRIEYPDDTTALAATSRQELPYGLIREAIARKLGKKNASELSPDDYEHLRELDIAGDEIEDIGALQVLTELEKLNLAFTEISDIRPLADLRRLKELILSNTQVSELVSLRRLHELRELSLVQTRVEDLGPLAGLVEMRKLMLWGTRVADLRPLAGMTHLEEISLGDTRVKDLAPLHGLTALRVIDIRGCEVGQDQVDALKEAFPEAKILR